MSGAERGSALLRALREAGPFRLSFIRRPRIAPVVRGPALGEAGEVAVLLSAACSHMRLPLPEPAEVVRFWLLGRRGKAACCDRSSCLKGERPVSKYGLSVSS